MENIISSRSEDGTVFSVVPPSLDQELVGAATHQAPSEEIQYLRKQNFEQASVIAALRDQIVAKEEVTMRILKTLRSELLIRKEDQKGLKGQDIQNPDLQVQLLQTPSNQLKDSDQHNTELAAKNAALKQQIAAKEVEKNKIMMAQRATMIEAQMDLQNMEQEKQKVIDSLRQSLLDKQNENVMIRQTASKQLEESQQVTKLAAENAALKQQMAAKEEEKMRILKDLRSERLIKKEAQKQAAENDARYQQLAAKECRWAVERKNILIQAQVDLQTKQWEKQKVIDSLSQSLLDKQNENVMIEQRWTECEKAREAWKEENREIRETCERKLQSALDQHNLMVKSLQEESDRKVSQVILEKDDLITRMTTAKMSLEAEWTTKLAALQDQSLKYEARLKEKEMQLLQSQVRLNEKEMQLFQSEVRLKEEEMQLFRSEAKRSTKLAALEDQIRIRTDTTTDLQAQVLRLQELNQKLDLGALMMTEEEMSAKKKELKKLIVEKEKEEKREKKEREEREKREKREREESEKEELKRVRRERRRDRNRRWWT